MIRLEYLNRNPKSIKNVKQEIQVHANLNHQNIVKMIDFGTDGQIVKKSGKKYTKIVYINLEYVSGGLLFDLCQS